MKTIKSAESVRDEVRIRTMFDRVAGKYDRINSVMTAGLHRRWRERAADLAALRCGDRALDVCCGTGDLALALVRRVSPGGEVVATDFSESMLALARRKALAQEVQVEFCTANTLKLPFEDRSFDACTVGFGVRNLADIDLGLAEMVRVVKPGGRVVCLEITTPKAPLSWFFKIWFDRIVPRIGTVAGNRYAYTYLPWSVRNFPSAPELACRMSAMGLQQVDYELLGGTAIAIHHGTVAN